MENKIAKCASRSGALLVVPFTLGTKQGRLNSDCIIKPVEHVKLIGKKIQVVYLRRSNANNVGSMDNLMKTLNALKIDSDEDYDRQAAELWKIVTSVLSP